MHIEMDKNDATLLTALLPSSMLGMASGLSYDGAAISAPDGSEVAAKINAIVADPNWKTGANKAALKAHAASARYNKETGGFAVGGVTYPTDRETQAKMAAAYALAQGNPNIAFDWKLPNGGFVALTAADVAAVATAVGVFVQQCFGAEASACIDIEAGTITTRAQIDARFA
jgi:hypothetical protein